MLATLCFRRTDLQRLLRTRMSPMLVLSRKVGQRILIGDQVAITVVRVSQGAVRIGVEAPVELPIVREEIKRELQAAPLSLGLPSTTSGPPLQKRLCRLRRFGRVSELCHAGRYQYC